MVGAAVLIAGSEYFWGETTTLELVGVEGDWDRNVRPPKTRLMEDTLTLRLRRDNSVEGESSATLEKPDRTKEKSSWRVTGFLVGDRLALSYAGRGPQSTAIGAYFLENNSSDYSLIIELQKRGSSNIRNF